MVGGGGVDYTQQSNERSQRKNKEAIQHVNERNVTRLNGSWASWMHALRPSSLPCVEVGHSSYAVPSFREYEVHSKLIVSAFHLVVWVATALCVLVVLQVSGNHAVHHRILLCAGAARILALHVVVLLPLCALRSVVQGRSVVRRVVAVSLTVAFFGVLHWLLHISFPCYEQRPLVLAPLLDLAPLRRGHWWGS